jgi:hypothetical protein
VLDSLEQFYDESNLPEVPSGDGAGETRRPRRRERAPAAEAEDGDEPARRPAHRLSPEAQRVLRNRRVGGAAAIAAALLFAILVWPIGVLGGDDDDGGDDERRAGRQEAQIEGQLALTPIGGARGNSSGLAVIARQGNRRNLIVQAQLRPVRDREAYEVWLYNSRRNAVSLGAQVTDRVGSLQGAGPLPAGYREYRFIDISREPINQDGRHSGVSVLRGRISDIQAPPRGAGQQQQQQPQQPQQPQPQR